MLEKNVVIPIIRDNTQKIRHPSSFLLLFKYGIYNSPFGFNFNLVNTWN